LGLKLILIIRSTETEPPDQNSGWGSLPSACEPR